MPQIWQSTELAAFPENLTPAEQRKLKSKQRKKAIQEAKQKEKMKLEEQQRQQQQQQQGKAKNQDPELEGPKEEELNPDKLMKVFSGWCYQILEF